MSKYILQSQPLDGRYDDVEDTYVSDGSVCRYKDVDGTEIGFVGGGWPSGGVDIYHKNKEKWYVESLPLPLHVIQRKLGDRNVDGNFTFFKVDEIVHSRDSAICYRIIKTKS